MTTNKNDSLDKLKKKNPSFSVPDNYFDDLPSIIQSKTSSPSSEKTPIWSLLTGWKSLRYALPAVLFACSVLFFFTQRPSTHQGEIEWASLEEEAILEYLSVYEDNEAAIYSLAYASEVEVETEDFLGIDDSALDSELTEELLNEYY